MPCLDRRYASRAAGKGLSACLTFLYVESKALHQVLDRVAPTTKAGVIARESTTSAAARRICGLFVGFTAGTRSHAMSDWPPSTNTSVPVTWLAASDTR